MQRLGKAGLAAAVLALTLVVAGSFGKASYDDYRLFTDYVHETVRDPAKPARWHTQVYSPEDCVDLTVSWVRGCPGQEQFCRGAMEDVARRCLESQDRSEYCAALGDDGSSTPPGLGECEAKTEGQDEGDAKLTAEHCAIGYRAIADHCGPLAAAGAEAP